MSLWSAFTGERTEKTWPTVKYKQTQRRVEEGWESVLSIYRFLIDCENCFSVFETEHTAGTRDNRHSCALRCAIYCTSLVYFSLCKMRSGFGPFPLHHDSSLLQVSSSMDTWVWLFFRVQQSEKQFGIDARNRKVLRHVIPMHCTIWNWFNLRNLKPH